jgi:hypothetical protein
VRRAVASRKFAIVEDAIPTAKYCLLITEDIERKSETRAEVILIYVVQIIARRYERKGVEIEVVEPIVPFTRDRADVIAKAKV